jgi:hypothetical protein
MATAPPPTSTGSSKVDAAKAQIAAHVDPTAPTGFDLYSRFAFAGAVCCSVTHGALTPVDVYVSPPPSGCDACQWLRWHLSGALQQLHCTLATLRSHS